jgi:hypothetical protein
MISRLSTRTVQALQEALQSIWVELFANAALLKMYP